MNYAKKTLNVLLALMADYQAPLLELGTFPTFRWEKDNHSASIVVIKNGHDLFVRLWMYQGVEDNGVMRCADIPVTRAETILPPSWFKFMDAHFKREE